MSALFTFTSANTSILINDKALSGVYKFEANEYGQDGKARYTHIKLQRHIIGDDELINEMRTAPFSFKLLSNNSSAGYVSDIAEVTHFSMGLSKEDNAQELLLTQTINLKTTGFFYSDDARSAGMKASEAEDLKNLIGIIKENQIRAKAPQNRFQKTAEQLRSRTDEVVVPDEDLVWLNANDPEQLKDVKPRKLKKNKNKRA